MTATAAVSVATFSAILAEAFAAVTLTSVQTNALIGGLRRARAQGRSLAALPGPASPAPAAPPAPASAPLTAASIGAAVSDAGVPVSVSPGGPVAQLDQAALRMFQFWANRLHSLGPLGDQAVAAMQAGGAALGELLVAVGRQVGITINAAQPVAADVLRSLMTRVGATVQGGQIVSAEVAQLVQALAGLGIDSDEVDLFVARSAKIHAEFEFQASDEFRFRVGQTSEQGGGLGALQIVSLAPGFSALYQSSSRNKITLDVEFALTNVKL